MTLGVAAQLSCKSGLAKIYFEKMFKDSVQDKSNSIAERMHGGIITGKGLLLPGMITKSNFSHRLRSKGYSLWMSLKWGRFPKCDTSIVWASREQVSSVNSANFFSDKYFLSRSMSAEIGSLESLNVYLLVFLPLHLSSQLLVIPK